MILSMTGFGKSMVDFPTKKVTVEVKTVNSKQLDVNFRIGGRYREKELEIRQELSKILERGKVDFSISIDYNGVAAPFTINYDLASYYFNEIKKMERQITGNSDTDYLGLILKMPDVMKGDASELYEDEWLAVKECINEAIFKCVKFREDEGGVLKNDFIMRIESILDYLSQTEKFEQQRIDKIRDRIRNNLSENLPGIKIDENRFEQEIVFFIEKIDITEEKVRLKKHCNYFVETLNSSENTGKKLNFICQEIGREINTLGSKANDYDMQKLVVMMKDELEKIKEQILNVL